MCCSTEEASGFVGESNTIGSQRDSHHFYGITLQRTEAVGQYDQTEWKRCDRKAVLNNDQRSGQGNGRSPQNTPAAIPAFESVRERHPRNVVELTSRVEIRPTNDSRNESHHEKLDQQSSTYEGKQCFRARPKMRTTSGKKRHKRTVRPPKECQADLATRQSLSTPVSCMVQQMASRDVFVVTPRPPKISEIMTCNKIFEAALALCTSFTRSHTRGA